MVSFHGGTVEAGAGVGRVIDVAASPASIARVRELADTYPFVYGAVGLHPDEIGALSDEMGEGTRVVLTGSLGANGSFTATVVALEG